MAKGTVKFFNQTKGFGFITHDETNTDFFVHKSNTRETLYTDDKVEFTIGQGAKGEFASKVQVI